MARVAFLGTPPAAVPSLRAVRTVCEISTVITRPDRPRGRSGRPRPSAVKEAALELGLDVSQPETSVELHRVLSELAPLDLCVVVAYGMLIPPSTLTIPERGFVNVHFSVLPRWRGAAPVQRAILSGDPRTGVSLLRLDEGLDTGPIVAIRSSAIGETETSGDLTARLAHAGAAMLGEFAPRLLSGSLVATPQPSEGVTVADKVRPEDARLTVEENPEAFTRRVRAMNPRPGAWAMRGGERMRIFRARPADESVPAGELFFTGDRLLCGVEGGSVELVEVQPEGKRPMPGADWARGRRGDLGSLS